MAEEQSRQSEQLRGAGGVDVREEEEEESMDVSSESLKRHEELKEMTETMFTKLSAYLMGELMSNSEDYRLLEQMNNAAMGKYHEMADTSNNLVNFMVDLQNKCKFY